MLKASLRKMQTRMQKTKNAFCTEVATSLTEFVYYRDILFDEVF